MNRKFQTLLGTVAKLKCSCFGEVQVTTEQVNPADPAGNFKTIPQPSRSDLALGATIRFLGNQPEAAAGEPEVLLKTHLDIGYTDRIAEVLKKYREDMMDSALKVVEASRSLPPEPGSTL